MSNYQKQVNIAPIPPGIDAGLQRTLASMAEAINLLQGQTRNTDYDRGLRVKELERLGVNIEKFVTTNSETYPGETLIPGAWDELDKYIAPKVNAKVTISDEGRGDRATVYINETKNDPDVWVNGLMFLRMTRNSGAQACASTVLYHANDSSPAGKRDIAFSAIMDDQNMSGNNCWGQWVVCGGPASNTGDWGLCGMEINTIERYADSGYKTSRTPGKFSVILQLVPENCLNLDGTGYKQGFNANFGLWIGHSAADLSGNSWPYAKTHIWPTDPTAPEGLSCCHPGENATKLWLALSEGFGWNIYR